MDATVTGLKFSQKAYTYSELLILRYFFCCRKKNPRYRKYLEHVSLISKRLDIIRLLDGQEHINTLSFVLMKPYQQKIIQFFKKIEDDSQKLPYSMPVEDALMRMKTRQTESDYNEIELKVNQKLERMLGEEDSKAFLEKFSPSFQKRFENEEKTLPFVQARKSNKKRSIAHLDEFKPE